jgi:tetratricopeptide (TPR) repeat protein
MDQLQVLVLLFLLLVASVRPVDAQSSDPAIKAIVDRYLTARGSLEKIRSVRTLILRGPPRPDGRPGRFMVKARPYYWMIGEPSPTRSFAEGFDGSHWEYYADPGLVMRPTGEPAAAARHTAYFDDALVYFGELGWQYELLPDGQVGADAVHWIRATFPDGFRRDYGVSKASGLVLAFRWAAPLHAVGRPIHTETRLFDWRPLNGALFPMRLEDYAIATGERIEPAPGWATAEVNVELPLDYFAPPPEPRTPLARMLNAMYASREYPADAMLWYKDFRANPQTAAINTEAGVEAVAFQMLKSGHIQTSIVVLEANVRDYAQSAAAHFHLGRAYRTAGREREAVERFNTALRLDPTYKQASDALAQPRSTPHETSSPPQGVPTATRDTRQTKKGGEAPHPSGASPPP